VNDCAKYNNDLRNTAIAVFALNAVWCVSVVVGLFVGPKDFSGLPFIWTLMLGLCPFLDIMLAGLLAYFHVRARGAHKVIFCAAFTVTLIPWLCIAFSESWARHQGKFP
jgi:hypothetical protein